jgi:hypothetical protein
VSTVLAVVAPPYGTFLAREAGRSMMRYVPGGSGGAWYI